MSGIHLDDLDAIFDHALFGEPFREVEAEEVTAEVERPSQTPPVKHLPRASPPAATAPARHTRRLPVLPSLVAEEEAWLRRMQEERSRQEPRPEPLTSLSPPPSAPSVTPPPVSVPMPVAVSSRHNRLLLVLALLGPVTLGLALGALLMRFAVQPELVRAAAPSQPVSAPAVAPAVAPVAPGVPDASSVPVAAVEPLKVARPAPSPVSAAPAPEAKTPSAPSLSEAPSGPAVHAAPAERKPPGVRAPAGAVLPSTPAGVPGPGGQAVPTAQPRHKREPMRPPSSMSKARSPGVMSDKEFDRALGFGSSP